MCEGEGHSYDFDNPKVGDLLYPGYTPVKAGVIIKVTPYTRNEYEGFHLTLKKKNHVEYTMDSLGMQCFRCLVEDHERKAQKHGDIARELEAL